MSYGEPFVWIAPGRQAGSPCIGGTRIPTENVASMALAGMDLKRICELYDLDRRAVLTALWYEATHSRHKRFRKEWGGWAREAGEKLWHGNGELPEPPRSARPEKQTD